MRSRRVSEHCYWRCEWCGKRHDKSASALKCYNGHKKRFDALYPIAKGTRVVFRKVVGHDSFGDYCTFKLGNIVVEKDGKYLIETETGERHLMNWANVVPFKGKNSKEDCWRKGQRKISAV